MKRKIKNKNLKRTNRRRNRRRTRNLKKKKKEFKRRVGGEIEKVDGFAEEIEDEANRKIRSETKGKEEAERPQNKAQLTQKYTLHERQCLTDRE